MLKNTLQSVANVIDGDVILVRASDLQDNLLDLVDLNLVPVWNGNVVYVFCYSKVTDKIQIKP